MKLICNVAEVCVCLTPVFVHHGPITKCVYISERSHCKNSVDCLCVSFIVALLLDPEASSSVLLCFIKTAELLRSRKFRVKALSTVCHGLAGRPWR